MSTGSDDGDDERFGRWPDLPRIAFGPTSDSPMHACLGWVQARREFYGYLEGYRRAAEVVYGSIEVAGRLDTMFLPLAFLWRHHLELALKDIIALGRSLRDEPWGFPSHHRLDDLWREARSYVEEHGSGDMPELGNVESNLAEFTRIDPSAAGFRYPLNAQRNDQSLADPPSHVDVGQFQEAMEALANFFSAVHCELTVRLEHVDAYRSEAHRNR
jgi:hypothetical protein